MRRADIKTDPPYHLHDIQICLSELTATMSMLSVTVAATVMHSQRVTPVAADALTEVMAEPQNS
jgi:hypothetical protein